MAQDRSGAAAQPPSDALFPTRTTADPKDGPPRTCRIRVSSGVALALSVLTALRRLNESVTGSAERVTANLNARFDEVSNDLASLAGRREKRDQERGSGA